jgi:hypothetical protein
MQGPVGRAQTFDGDEFFSVQCRKELNTGVYRLDLKAFSGRIDFSDRHGTCAAVAFGTTLLGADSAKVFAKILQHGAGRLGVANFDNLTVKDKSDCVFRGHVSQLPR